MFSFSVSPIPSKNPNPYFVLECLLYVSAYRTAVKIHVTSFSWKVITVFTFLKTEANLPDLSGVKLVIGKFKMEKIRYFSVW